MSQHADNFVLSHVAEFKDFARPVEWKVDIWDLDNINPGNNGLQNEDLIVWMRTPALPSFQKLYRKINHDNPGKYVSRDGYGAGLPKGKYLLEIEYSKLLELEKSHDLQLCRYITV